jgi:hypothetical protein
MRKVIESTLVSLDGVIGDPLTWINGYFGQQAQEVALAQLLVSDALLMGRHTYEMFAATSDAGTSAYWWINNGVVEGHVTKLKLIKRQGYGRAGFPLLRKRVLHAL